MSIPIFLLLLSSHAAPAGTPLPSLPHLSVSIIPYIYLSLYIIGPFLLSLFIVSPPLVQSSYTPPPLVVVIAGR